MIMPNKIFVEMLFDNGICKLVKQGCSAQLWDSLTKNSLPKHAVP